MNLIITTPEMLESLIDSSVSKAVENIYSQREKINNRKKLYTIKEASEELSVSILTIRNYIAKGFLDGKKIGKRVLVTNESIQNSLKEIKSLRYKR